MFSFEALVVVIFSFYALELLKLNFREAILLILDFKGFSSNKVEIFSKENLLFSSNYSIPSRRVLTLSEY
jgi:hypothetical protein